MASNKTLNKNGIKFPPPPLPPLMCIELNIAENAID